MKNLSKIIHARVVEIIDHLYLEIKNYGHEEQKKKLIAGIVLTGGGSQLKHLKQLVEYITGMDTRVGYPNEHLAGDSDSETTSPMYATAVGLVLNSLEHQSRVSESMMKMEEEQNDDDEKMENEDEEQTPKERKRFFDKWAEKFKEFLDNAE